MACSLRWSPPCQHYSLAGQEHGRTIPLSDMRDWRSIFRRDRRREVDQRQADAADDGVTCQPVLGIELAEPVSVEVDRYHLHHFERIADQWADGHNTPFERSDAVPRTAVAGHLIVNVSPDAGGKAGCKMLIDVPLEVELISGLVIRCSVDVVQRHSQRNRYLEAHFRVEVR